MVEDFYRISSLMFIQRLDLSLQCRIVKQIDALQEEVSTLATSLNFVNRILVVTGQSSIQAPLFLNSPEAEKFLLALQEADVVFRDLEYLEQVGHISRVGLKNILNPLRKRYQELQAILRTKRTLH